MKFNFRRIASGLASMALVGATVGLGAATNYPAPFNDGSALVYGSAAASSDLVAAIDITNSLGGGTGSTDTTITGEAYPLFTSSSPLLLNASINTIKTSATESNLPTVLADTDFSGNVESTATFTIHLGTYGRTIFAKEPTSSDDPSVGVRSGTTAANHLYNATTTFNKAVNFTHADSEGEELILFGQPFTVASATDNDDLVLFRSSQTIFFSSDTNPSEVVEIDGETYTVDLVAASDTSATIRVTDSTGASDQKEINEAASKKILGVEVSVNTADESDALGVISAEVIIGASRIKLTDGQEVKIGTNEEVVDGTQVDFGDTTYPGNLTTLTIQIFAESGSDDFITPGSALIDPIFESFKMDFSGLNNDGESDRETINIDVSGNSKMTIGMTNWQDKSLVSWEWVNNETGKWKAFLGDSSEWRIMVQEMGQINESAFAVVGNEDDGYLIRLRTLSNSSSSTPSDDTVIFENVFDTTQTWEAQITATEGSGTIDIGGRSYSVTYLDDRDGDDDEYVRLQYPDSTSATEMVLYPTIETVMGAKLAFYETLTIDLGNWDGTGTKAANVTAFNLPDGNGYTSIAIVSNDTSHANAGDWNITFGSTVTTINTTAAALTESARGAIGPLNYNVSSSGTLDNVVIHLNDVDGSIILTPAIILFTEQDDSNVYQAAIIRTGGGGTSDNGIGVSDVDFTWNADGDMVDGSAYGTSGFQREDDDKLYEMMDFWGTLIRTDQSTSDQYTAVISYPDNQVDVQLYMAETGASITGGSSGTSSAGSVTVKDSEVQTVSGRHLIVIGGSCVNSVAASLLGSDTPLCGSDWETATDVGSGSYLIETFASPFTSGKIATIVAGYNAGDTTNAATFLTTQNPSTNEGDKYIGSTATSASMVTAEV